jgi:nucleotide-binding universal stress UspA family protein
LPATDGPVRVVIAYDGSEPARAAIDEFVRSSWGSRCDVDLVHVLPHASLFARAVSVDVEAAKEEGRKLLAEVAEELRPVVGAVHSHVLEGDSIGEAISDFVAEHGIDLVMMGETGRSALSQLFLGSVTRYVLRHAACSVWVSRAHREPASA